MALDWCQNLVSIQYLENKLMHFDEIFCMQYYKPDLGENVSYSVKMIIYSIFVPWQMSKSCSNVQSFVPW